ncbi:MAG: prepilin-type N-terminal cleavage/methylation domain-containing protein [Candidatus Hydrogenedentes bacterium]|nr:prepilin-type N-terminal cleavage/methylation domain-containing protein [Candidatus Hydrogenedentota bacterium]
MNLRLMHGLAPGCGPAHGVSRALGERATTQRATTQAGFSLLEVMVAVTILAVGLIAVMQLFPASLRQSRVAAERTTVASLANTELGRVKAGGVGNQLSQWAADNAQVTAELLASAGNIYAASALYSGWKSSVQRVGGDVDLYRVTFSVQMFDGREENFVTYVTRQ